MPKVFFSDQSIKDSKKIPEIEKKKLKKKISFLETEPFLGKKLGGELEGSYSMRVWPYRVIYLIKKNGDIWITHIFHRQGAYR